MWRNKCFLLVWVVAAVWVVDGAASQSLASADKPRVSDASRFQEIRRDFLDMVGNSTSSVKSMSEMLTLLHSSTGRQLGRLLLEGVMLGVQEKESGVLLSQFWTDLQERLSPHLLEQLDNYRDFFRGMDLSTVPLMWEQLFQKDELGNSLAGIPLGQLVDMIQPISTKYGIDVRAFVNSLMGQGQDNARDLLLDALSGVKWTSLLSNFFNSTSSPSAIQTTESDPRTTTKTHAKKEEKNKKGKNDKTLRLFRPLVASMLRENKINLDVDAVLEVVAPLLSGDLISQAAPLLASLSPQAGGGIMPLIANALGGGGGQQKQQQMGGLLGGLGALLAGGGNGKMDLGTMINMASMFMDNDKPTKKSRKQSGNKEEVKTNGLDMGTLLNLAGQLAESNNINIGSVLEATSSFLTPEKKHKPTPKEEDKAKPSSQPKKQKKRSGRVERPRHLIDILEPILLSMQTDKKCNRKIKDAITFGKTMLNNKVASMGDANQLLALLASNLVSEEFMSSRGLNLNTVVTSFKNAMTHASWMDLVENLENEDYRESLVRTVRPHATELVTLLSSQEVQKKLYDAGVPRIQTFFSSYGLPGITLDNFPERVAPMVALFGKGWNLPFNPTTVLVPVRDYLKDTLDWAETGLKHIRTLELRQVELEVSASLEEAFQGVLAGVRVTRDSNVMCLQERLCHVTGEMTTLGKAITRTVSLVLAVNPVLETTDSKLLVKTVQAISGSTEECEDTLPEYCEMDQTTDQEEDENSMDLDYEHQEL